MIRVLDDPGIPSVPGFYVGAESVGIKTLGERPLDLGLLYAETRCQVTGVFSTNELQGSPLLVTMEHLADGHAQALIANSGCSNTYTGPAGIRDARRMAEATAERLGLPVRDVLVASTGVIGVRLPMDRVERGIRDIQITRDRGLAFAQAIMTTDTRPKLIAIETDVDGVPVRIAGVAKGAGMIHPQMATMFCFLVTNAALDPGYQQDLVRWVADRSLNAVTVDGDTSPDDMMLLWASGTAGNPPVEAGTPAATQFEEALLFVAQHLAREIARDGEGATTLIEVRVGGAASFEEALRAARQVVGSPLVKSAVHGRDPNWGRILSAIGQSRVRVQLDRSHVAICGHVVFQDGEPVPFDAAAVSRAMQADTVSIEASLGAGTGEAMAWGCDLSADYVHINADYTT